MQKDFSFGLISSLKGQSVALSGIQQCYHIVFQTKLFNTIDMSIKEPHHLTLGYSMLSLLKAVHVLAPYRSVEPTVASPS